jgi:hypothetical protein
LILKKQIAPFEGKSIDKAKTYPKDVENLSFMRKATNAFGDV